MTAPRAAFFGTPAAAVPSLAALSAAVSVELVVTRPDKPRGRSGTPQSPAVKEAAEAWGIPVVQPVKAVEAARLLTGLDLAVVVAYGLAGDETTGVDIMQLDSGMDTGPIFAGRSVEIDGFDTTGTLTARLAGLGAELLTETLPSILDGTATLSTQSEEGVTIASKLTSRDARIDPRRMPAEMCLRVIRAFNPNPGAWGTLDGDRLKVWQARVRTDREVPAGETLLEEDAPLVGTPGGVFELVEVQAAGRSRMPAAVWGRGHRGAFRWD